MRGRARSAALVLSLIVPTAGAVVGSYVGVHEYRLHRSTGKPVATSTPSPLIAATDAPTTAANPPAAPVPNPAAVARAIATSIAAPELGPHVLAEVVDAASAALLYNRLGAAVAAPASTAKLLTAAAVLTVREPTARIATRIVAGATPGTIVLVGGGDPTLTAAAGSSPGAYPDAARIGDLAAQLRAAHVAVTRIVVDDSLFSGPSTSPAWAPGDAPSDYAAPITAAMVDGGRTSPGDAIRSGHPDLAAGHALAAATGNPSAVVTTGAAPAGAAQLAIVRSAPLAELVEQMLQQSDNVIAECLARQVAVATNTPASFVGSAAAVRSVLVGLGVDPGAGLLDGSGLAAADRVSVASLAGVLRLVASSAHPALHYVVTGLPVAGWSGTLAARYRTTATGELGAGVVRAKTGTLTGVSSLAGFVRDASGRLLVFALIADRVPAGGTVAAETALDRAVAALASCGCA